MTKEETRLENNKLIAEFMGYKLADDKFHWVKFNGDKLDSMMQFPDINNYGEDWNWLIPVCSKFNDLWVEDENNKKLFGHEYMQLCDDLDAYVITYDIKNVYKQLIKNIKYYNKQK